MHSTNEKLLLYSMSITIGRQSGRVGWSAAHSDNDRGFKTSQRLFCRICWEKALCGHFPCLVALVLVEILSTSGTEITGSGVDATIF